MSNASKAHMMGLMEMLKIRGGLSSLAHNPVLLRVLTWYRPLEIHISFNN